MARILLIFLILFFPFTSNSLSTDWRLPVHAGNRNSWKTVELTSIGFFGLKRKARPGIPAHLHTGVDIKRPTPNYDNEPIFPVYTGRVVSLRDDGPFAQIIISHRLPNHEEIWTVYEHIAGINVRLGEFVDTDTPMARFMTRAELNRYGWQFDHLHFEIMKIKPRPLKVTKKTPFRLYSTHSLRCYSYKDLHHYYHNPIDFFKSKWK